MITEERKRCNEPLNQEVMMERPTPKLLNTLGVIHDANLVNGNNIGRLHAIFQRVTGENVPEVSDAPDLKAPQSENLNDITHLLSEEVRMHSQLISILIERLEEYV